MPFPVAHAYLARGSDQSNVQCPQVGDVQEDNKEAIGICDPQLRALYVQAVQTRQPKTFSCPTNLSDNDISNNPDGAKYLW